MDKRVWIKCAMCNGLGVTGQIIMIPVSKNGYTHYMEHPEECPYCQGDKGHRV